MIKIKVKGEVVEFKQHFKHTLCYWCGKKYKCKNLYSMLIDAKNSDGTTTYSYACICNRCNLKHDVV